MGEKIKIVIAEDHKTVREGIKLLVNAQSDMEVVGEAGDGDAAIKEIGRHGADFVLMDISMPMMNGLEATAAIRAREAAGGGHVPIVGVTAHALKGDRERCLEAGMDDYLSKPISPNALLAKVELWMDDRASRTVAG